MALNISVIILSFNGVAFIGDCLQSVRAQSVRPAEVIVVDNGSHDGSAELVASRFPEALVIQNRVNLGVAAGWNVGVAAAHSDVLAFVNQDVTLDPKWLSQLAVAFATHPTTAIVGSKLLYPDASTLQHAGGLLSLPLGTSRHIGAGEVDRGQYDTPSQPVYVTGAAFGITLALLDAVSGFDSRFFPAYYEDVDMCLAARAHGASVLYWPACRAIHVESTTLGAGTEAFFYAFHKNRLRFIVKHLSDDDLQHAFPRLEAARLDRQLPPAERKALARIYGEGPDGLGPRIDEAPGQSVVHALRVLAQRLDR